MLMPCVPLYIAELALSLVELGAYIENKLQQSEIFSLEPTFVKHWLEENFVMQMLAMVTYQPIHVRRCIHT